MKVLFAIDGSKESSHALDQVATCLTAQKDAVALYYSVPDILIRNVSTPDEVQERMIHSIVDAVFTQARGHLPGEIAAGLQTIQCRHSPGLGILEEAEKWGAEMVVMGARGMSSIDRMLLGSVSRAVVHHSPIPVFVSRSRDVATLNQPWRILFASDGSSASEAALAAAQQLSFPANSTVIAVTVADSSPRELPEWMVPDDCRPETAEMIAAFQRETENDKRRLRDQLAALLSKQASPFQQAEIVISEGHAADQILKLAEAHKVDLIILGSEGKGLLKRLLIGSTSEQVLNHASCSVLIARGK